MGSFGPKSKMSSVDRFVLIKHQTVCIATRIGKLNYIKCVRIGKYRLNIYVYRNVHRHVPPYEMYAHRHADPH